MAYEIHTAGEAVSTWGEGPVWAGDRLIYVDIEGHLIRSFHPQTGNEESWEVGERIGFIIPTQQEDQWIAGGDSGIFYFNPKTSEKTPIVNPEGNVNGDNRFNDGKCDPTGRLWAGTISTVKKEGDAALYSMNANHQLDLRFPNVTNSNGLAWSEEKSKMYYIDTPSKKIRVFDIDFETGEISNEAVAFSTEDFEGSPDGMTIDSEGQLWVAFCHGGVVRCFDPESGDILDWIEFPTVEVTSCTFGGADLKTLYVTSGNNAKLDEAAGGRLFAVKTEVTGTSLVNFG